MSKLHIEEWIGSAQRLFRRTGCFVMMSFAFGAAAQSPISISGNGTPNYSYTVAVPPGIAGMSPNIGLLYSASTVNGPVGYGWTIQGISMISRCQANRLTDGTSVGVDYDGNDKLCLDGQRLIQTDANGSVVNGSVINPGFSNPFQQNDALGGTGLVREFRTENDMYARIRAYGSAGGNPANGPAYFKVWTKAGQIFEYGVNSNVTANALINARGKTVIIAWPVSRISDTVGNYIDFQYGQRDINWGSKILNLSDITVSYGHEWVLNEIRYTGNASQLPNNKIVFTYDERPDNPLGPQDRTETYHLGSKNVSIYRLNAIRTYVNWPADLATQPENALKVKTIKLSYDNGPVTNRSRLASITECADASEAQCFPPTSFTYSSGANGSYAVNVPFNMSFMATMDMNKYTDASGKATGYGVLPGNFLGSGRTDIFRWADDPAQNGLFKNSGDGNFQPLGGGMIPTNLFKSDGCYASFSADFNGDGLTDILRIMREKSVTGASCGTMQHMLFLSNGDGSFRQIDIYGIDFTQTKSNTQIQTDCLSPKSDAFVANCEMPGENVLAQLVTQGKNFYLIDVNNDGLLDIVTTTRPGMQMGANQNPPFDCLSVCTHIFLGLKDGGFGELFDTNLAYIPVYADPPLIPNISNVPYVADINGDGMSDLQVGTGAYISRGDGNFDSTWSPTSSLSCPNTIDFNGDGRNDCIFVNQQAIYQRLWISNGTNSFQNGGNFNLTTAGDELYGVDSTTGLQNVGILIADMNGNGRSDIIRWADNPGLNAVYLSNGDGTFRKDPDFYIGTNLQKSDGTFNFITGDFTGYGNTEILRVVSNPDPNNQGDKVNALFVKTNTNPPDQLMSVVTSGRLATTLTWVPLSNSESGSLGARFSSDRGTANAATYPVADLVLPSYVVATAVTDSGVHGQNLYSEYSYSGLKYAYDGRGWLGFRKSQHQYQAPDFKPLTVETQYLQSNPYIGMAGTTKTVIGVVNSVVPQTLSVIENIYCDMTSGTPPQNATSAAPCPANSQVRQPYLYRSIESGYDLDGTALPVVTTTNTFNTSGDPTQIVVSTAGDALGLPQSFIKTSTNSYFPSNTSGDAWILGRLQSASVSNNVPNSLSNIATSAGVAPDAALTRGRGLLVTMNPVALVINSETVGEASGVVSASAAGGATPYLYSWMRTSGSLSQVSSNTVSNPMISAVVGPGDNFTETWQVTITDQKGNAGIASVNVNFVGPGS